VHDAQNRQTLNTIIDGFNGQNIHHKFYRIYLRGGQWTASSR